MSFLALTAAVLLSQAEPAAAPAADAPAAAPAAVAADPGAAPTQPRSRAPSAEELQRQLDRIRKLPATESGDAMQDLFRKYPEAANPNAYPSATVVVPGHIDSIDANSLKLGALSDAEQVKYTARIVFNSIIAGDARTLVLQSAYPFQLEDRRLEMPDELHKEWLKNLRSKRTDLLTLYDVEVLTPAEMEKKYGRPPTRLNALPWKAPRTMIAVGNLSGHAAVAVFRAHPNGRWQMVGYHD